MNFNKKKIQINLKSGDLQRMRVISNNIFFAGKSSEMGVAPTQCGRVHICVIYLRLHPTILLKDE